MNPDIVGSVTDIEKIVDKKYDCILCCQVLEHLPFEMLDNVLSQFQKITNKNVIISLPNNDFRLITAKVFLPFIRNFSFKILFPKFWHRHFRLEKEGFGEHYYEVGAFKECKDKNIRKIMNQYFQIVNKFNPIENVYHIFYILKSK